MFKHLILASLIAFSLQVDNCVTQKKYCKRCNTDFYVLIEYENYKQKVSKCIKKADYELIKAIDENCIDADSPYQTCKECKRGYHTANSGKKCIQLDHCQTENNEKCETCYPPFAKKESEGKCEKKPLCEIIGNDNKCTDCIYYYYPKDGECKSIPIEDCMVGDENTCTQCNTAVSYLNSENKCSKIPEHCTNFNKGEKKCKGCENHYYPNADGLKCESITIDKCLQATDANTCTACDTGYYVNEQKTCTKMTDNCNVETFDHYNKKCKNCVDHYYLTKEFTCVSIPIEKCLQASDDKTCTQCEKGYFINKDNTCTKIPDHCEIIYNKQCTQCENHFYPNADGSKCESITIDKCLQAKDAKTCSSCEEGYYVNTENTCTKITDNCDVKTFDHSNRRCIACVERYYLTKEYTCAAITIDKCIHANDANTCSTCENKYYVVGGNKCEKIPIANCQQASNDKTCTLCEDGYYVDKQYTCTVLPSHCKQFDYLNRVCTVCDDNYYKKGDNDCQPYSINNCIVQVAEKKCQQCKVGYEPNESGDTCNQICMEEQDVCTACASNYDSFNYGESCEVLDPSKIPPKSDNNFSSFINFNLVLATLILSLIL